MRPDKQRLHRCRLSFKQVAAITIGLFMSVRTGTVSAAGSAIAQNKIVLSPDSQIERDIGEGEVHIYSLSPGEGRFVRLAVEGTSSDVIVALADSDGKSVVEVSSTIGFRNQKRLSFVAMQEGDYQLTVRQARKAPRGSYKLKVVAWRRVEPKDESAVSSERLFEEADKLTRAGSGDATRQAIEKYELSLPLWRAAGERMAEAFVLLKVGLTLHNLSRFKEAVDRYNQALPIFEEIGDERGVAQTLNNLGWSLSGLGKFQQAIECYNRALAIRRRLGEPRTIAQTLNLMAEALQATGDAEEATNRFNEAVPLARAGGDSSIEAYALNGLAWIHIQAGEFEKARDCVDRALPLWRKVGNARGEATSLHLRGTIHADSVNAAEALESFQQAIQIWRGVGNRYGEASVLNNLGVLYQNIGDQERARETYLQSLSIWQAIGNRSEEASTLNNLGIIEANLGRLESSLEFSTKALAMLVAEGNRKGQVTPLENIGLIHFDLGHSRQASDYLERALKLAQETGERFVEAGIRNSIGFVSESAGDEPRAIEEYRQSLAIHESYSALVNLARIERNRGDFSEALALATRATRTVESRRAQIADQQLRLSLGVRARDAYDLYADILMRMNERALASHQPAEQHVSAAFEASEKAHARSLLDTLAEARADIRRGADAELLAEERAVQARLNAREARRAEALNSSGQEKRLPVIDEEIQKLDWQLEDVRGRIRTGSPAYAALTQPASLSAGDIQKLLDGDTVLLEYLLGTERSLVWAVTPTSIRGYVLPSVSEIEPMIRRVYESLTSADPTAPESSRGAASSNATVDYDKAAGALSRVLLGPVADQLHRKRLLIVSDGALGYIPFAALPSPEVEESKSKGGSSRRASITGSRPLILDHEIVSLPSASVLSLLRREATERPPAPKALAVLADPVFNSNDPRVSMNRSTRDAAPRGALAGGAASGGDVIVSSHEVGLNDFARLHFSRLEAEAITSLVPEEDRLRALDFNASRATAQGEELSKYRILHFATHGLLNSRHPELSGLVFSLVDEQGKSQDGFLRFHEIYNMKLNADLVVLSACQTALGQEVRGEGLIGLTRGFMYAGVPRVVASLWRVEDRATAELMKAFYQAMLKEKLRPAAALRAAQVSMLRDRRWAAPHYWAAFTLQGEWR